MLDTILHSHFVAGLISGGLAVAARDLAVGLFSGMTLLFAELKKHPNSYVTPDQLDQFHKDIVADIATQAAQSTVAVTVNPAQGPAPVTRTKDTDIPMYNQD